MNVFNAMNDERLVRACAHAHRAESRMLACSHDRVLARRVFANVALSARARMSRRIAGSFSAITRTYRA